MPTTLARQIIQTCLDSCKAYDLPSEDYVQVVKEIAAVLETHRADIHAEVADFLESEAGSLQVGFKGKEAQMMQVALESMAAAVRQRT